MKKILIFSMMLIFSRILNAADGKITGKIVSEKNDALSFVTVSVGTDKGAYTNNKGYFVIENLEFGTYQVVISYIGFEKKVIENIKISEDAMVADLGIIKLKESPIRIPEVSVVAIRTNFNEKHQSSNNIISSEDLKQSQPIGTEEALKTLPGVNVSGDMGISNRLNIGIRGSYPRRSGKLLLLEDGTPIAPAPYLAPEAYYNPPSDRMDGIEIIKGADILTYGPNTMYGVVNYITKRPPLKPALGVNLTGGENGYHSEFITYGGTWNNLGAELQVLNKHFDGFQLNSATDIFNTTAKVYADFGKRSSAYLKINYHQENSKATYSGLTPLSFRIDPRQNPFDADDLLTKRYATDMVYNFKFSEKLISSSKIYGSQFTRDWWRQNNSVQKASDVRKYTGQEIFDEKYSYLVGQSLTPDDYVRVGAITKIISNKDTLFRQSTTARNRLFRVAGAQETLKLNLVSGKVSNNIELGFRVHTEQFFNQEMKNDSSRFARSGKIVKDEKYLLTAGSVYLKNEFTAGKISLTPALRFEIIEMRKFDMTTIATNPSNDGNKYFGSQKNTFNQVIPGLSMSYKILDTTSHSLSFYGGIYRGYTPPTSEVGFFVLEDESIVNTKAVKDVQPNMLPEISNNFEAGLRGYFFNNGINGQLTYFNNSINNYYAPGRSEAFQTLGSVNINGVEAGISLSLKDFIKSEKQNVKIGASYTYLNSRITGGKLTDSDLLSAKHTDATKEEIINEINGRRNGYHTYFSGNAGADSLVSRELTSADFSKIKKVEMVFGKDGISDNKVPYVPEGILNLSLTYCLKELCIGGNYNMVSAQYTDYLNLDNETAEGAIGKLPAFSTIDLNASYNFSSQKNRFLDGLTMFVAGKNILDEVYKASRLHRVASGIMPGGFRQINAGIKLTL